MSFDLHGNPTESKEAAVGAATMAQLLIRVEWAGDRRYFECPYCHASQARGHEHGCELDKAIRSWIAVSATYGIVVERVAVAEIQARYRDRVTESQATPEGARAVELSRAAHRAFESLVEDAIIMHVDDAAGLDRRDDEGRRLYAQYALDAESKGMSLRRLEPAAWAVQALREADRLDRERSI